MLDLDSTFLNCRSDKVGKLSTGARALTRRVFEKINGVRFTRKEADQALFSHIPKGRYCLAGQEMASWFIPSSTRVMLGPRDLQMQYILRRKKNHQTVRLIINSHWVVARKGRVKSCLQGYAGGAKQGIGAYKTIPGSYPEHFTSTSSTTY
jgi:hypothetical protein